MLQHFQEIRMIQSFKQKYPEYSDKDVDGMRVALLKAGDIEKVWGLTRETRYVITESGKRKLEEK